ncbi:MAG: hypothetical protein AABW64_02800 [Nanoarchaeota archaeon]
MVDALILEKIVQSLNQEGTSRRKRREFLKECKENRKPELGCILACEAGEWGTEIVAYHGLSLGVGTNELGFLGGIALGTLAALFHTYRHGKKHNQKTTIGSALNFALATESGCVLGATTVDYLAAKYAGMMEDISNNPLDPTNMLIRAIALPFSYLAGLGIMSLITYRQREMGSRIIAEKDALLLVRERLEKYQSLRLITHYNGNGVISLDGRIASITIEEKPLKKSESEASYDIRSRVFRYRSDICEPATTLIFDCLDKEGKNPRRIEDAFKHK